MSLQIQSMALLSGLRIQHCRELCCRSQTGLRSGIAVAVTLAGSCSSNLTAGLEPPYATGAAPERQNDKTKQNKKKEWNRWEPLVLEIPGPDTPPCLPSGHIQLVDTSRVGTWSGKSLVGWSKEGSLDGRILGLIFTCAPSTPNFSASWDPEGRESGSELFS